MTTLLDAALRYAERGWCIIPVNIRKKPTVRWKRFQAERPTEADLRRWFGGKTAHAGLAAVCGAVSGGLVVRDFDALEAYQRWADAYPKLAATLPTVRTARGWHVYFHSAHETIISIDGGGIHEGELRGGGYTVLPPSRHANGRTYTWTIALPESGTLPVLDAVASGLLPAGTGGGVIEQGEQGEQVEHPPPTLPCACSITSAGKIEEIIASTLPTGPGQRNQAVFRLARALKAERLADATLRAIVLEWHKRARPMIRTKGAEETLTDFWVAWGRVRYPAGCGPLDSLVESAKASPPPAAALRYDDANIRLLVAICRKLQEAAGDSPFFLSCGTAGRLLDVSAMCAWRWMFLLQADGVLVLAERGTKRRAARYFYTGDKKPTEGA